MTEMRKMFKDNLVTLHKRARISQEELAHVIGVSRQSISKYETGTAEPDFNRLDKLREYFDVSYNELLGELQDDSVKLSTTGSITIQSAIDARMTQYNMFKIERVFGHSWHDSPQVQLLDEMTKNNNGFLGPDEVPLGWYATQVDAEKELKAIQSALSAGKVTYKLRYNVTVSKRGILGWKIDIGE